MSAVAGILLTVALLLLNAFFVGAEFALVSARRTKIEPQVEAGSVLAKITLYAMEHVSLMMAGAQLGITIASLALGSLSEPAIAHLLEVPLELVGVPGTLLHPIAFTLALTLVTFLHVVIGEMVPKNLALSAPEGAALLMAPLLVLIVWALYPLLLALNGVANVMLRMAGIEPKHEVTSAFTRDEVADLVEESLDGGLIELNDERLLLGALHFGERDVRSVLGCEIMRVGGEAGVNGVAVLALLQPLPGLPTLFLEAFCARHRLSPREQEVIGLLLEGLGTADMANRLSISEHTVRDHLKRLYRKTGTRSRSELLSVLSTARMEPAAAAAKR